MECDKVELVNRIFFLVIPNFRRRVTLNWNFCFCNKGFYYRIFFLKDRVAKCFYMHYCDA